MSPGKSEAGGLESINCHFFSLKQLYFHFFLTLKISTFAKLNIHCSKTVRTTNDFSETVQCHVHMLYLNMKWKSFSSCFEVATNWQIWHICSVIIISQMCLSTWSRLTFFIESFTRHERQDNFLLNIKFK